MKIYKYDIQTKEFLEEIEINEAYGSNLPFTTDITPLTKKDGFAICFNKDKWEYIEDNRNKTVYSKETKQELKVDYLGKIKDTETLLKPSQFDEWDYAQNKWVENQVEANNFRIQAINNKSESIITTPYPIYKQLNIDNELAPYTYQDRELKNMFIESVREIGKQAKNDGAAVDDIDWAGLDEIIDPIQINKVVLISMLEKFKVL